MTNSVIAVLTDAVSTFTVTVTGALAAVVFCTDSVKPSTTLVSVLLAELMAMPLSVRSALSAVLVRCMVELAWVASNASADRPVAGLPSSRVSVALMRNAFSAPVSRERRLKRDPEASLTMLAVTPAPALLILSRKPVRLVSPSPMLMVTAVAPDLGVKSAAGEPSP